jgi:hypothetical protein
MGLKGKSARPFDSPVLRLFVAVFVVTLIVRVATGFTSWADFGQFLVVLVTLAGAGAVIVTLGMRVRARRLDHVRHAYPGAHVWLVNTTLSSLVLIVTDDEILCATRGGKIRHSWRRDQLRRAVVERVRIGWPSRPGLRLELGRHQTHETLTIAFPTLLGLWASGARAREALGTLEQH